MILRSWLGLWKTPRFETSLSHRRRTERLRGGWSAASAHQPAVFVHSETLEDRALLAVDFGDAPDNGAGTGTGNYQTLASDNGPSHTIVAGLFLGAHVDGDTGTLQNAAANADDMFSGGGSDDEDGVLSPLDLQATIGSQPTITLLVTNKTGHAATLSGWIDYNHNGVFENATERAQATINTDTTNGRVTLTFPTIPIGAVGQTYARFRLSTDAAASNPTGPASDGEVEDYLFSVKARVSAAPNTRTTALTNTSTGEVYSGRAIASAGDLDGDGVADIALSPFSTNNAIQILFMKHDGTVKSSHVIIGSSNPINCLSSFGSSITCLGDISGDGVPDLAVGAANENTSGISGGAIHILFMNPDGTVKSSSTIGSGIHGGPVLHNGDAFGFSTALIGDTDGDGINDLAVGAPWSDSTSGAIYILSLKPDGTAKSATRIVDASSSLSLHSRSYFGYSVAALGDLDGDGLPELATRDYGRIDTLSLNAANAIQRNTMLNVFSYSVTCVGDINGDGVNDVITSDDLHSGAVLLLLSADGSVRSSLPVAYKAIPDSGFGSNVTYSSTVTFSASIPDLNGDGLNEILITSDVELNDDNYTSITTTRLLFLASTGSVASFTRLKPATAHTNADTLSFRARFDGDVLNVDPSDFSVTGGTSATVSKVKQVSASTYNIIVSGGDLASFAGTVGISLALGQDITDTNGAQIRTTSPAINEIYTVDNTRPSITAIQRNSSIPAVTSADSISFSVLFDKPVQNVDVTDFAITGGSTGKVQTVLMQSPTRAEVVAYGGNLSQFNGTVGLTLAPSASIADLAGNALDTSNLPISEEFTLDNTPPTLLQLEQFYPTNGPVHLTSAVFLATFNEPVVLVNANDFIVTGSTTAKVSQTHVISGSNQTQYRITVSGGNLASFNGVVGITLSPAGKITDLSNNRMLFPNPAPSASYTVENNPLKLVSIERYQPSDSTTHGDSLVFLATFDKSAQNIDTADFVVNGSTTAIVTTVKAVSGTDRKQFRITVSGGDLGSRSGVVGLDLASDVSIFDSVNNSLPRIEPKVDQTYQLDNTAPVISSIRRQNPSTSVASSDSLVFRVRFSEPVTGVGIDDFVVNGLTTARVTAVNSVSGSHDAQYDVVVSGGDLSTFNGAVGLNLSPAALASDQAGNVLLRNEPATDQTYLVQNSIPSLLSIRRQAPASSSTNADQLVYRLTFSEPVIKVDVADFAVSGASTATVSNVRPVNGMNRTQYDVTVSGGDLADFNGFVGLNLATQLTIKNSDGNSLASTESAIDEVYSLNQTNPQTLSFRRQSPSGDATNADQIVFRATFSEGVTGVDVSDFSVDGLPSARIKSVSPVDGSGLTQYDVTVVGGGLWNFNGTVGLNFSDTVDISDLDSIGNSVPATEPPIDETWTIDNVSPAAVSFRRKVPADRVTDADVLDFLVTFNEPMTGVDPSDFVITGGTTAAIARVKVVDNSGGLQYRVTVSGGNLADFNGTVGLDFAPDATITDPAGNALPIVEPAQDATFLLDNVIPAAVSIERHPAATQDSLLFRVTFNEAVTGVDVSDFVVDGTTTATVTAVNAVPDSGNTQFDVTISGGNLARFNGQVGLNFAPSRVIHDVASGQSLTGMDPLTDEVDVLKNGNPVAVSFNRQDPTSSSTAARSLVFRATFSETVTGVDSADFAVSGTTATVTSVNPVDGSSNTQFDVTVSGGNLPQLTGVVGLNFAASPTMVDMLGHVFQKAEPTVDQTYQITQPLADYGDAPDTGAGIGKGNYQTLASDNGPSHIVVPGLYLGAGVDADNGLNQSASADADDRFTSGGRDDEDGVLDPLSLRQTVMDIPVITLLATNSTGSDATLTGWIDYNRNGVFEDVYESASAVVPSGTVNGRFTLTFPIIAPVLPGTTFARFRLSTDAAASSPTGRANNGEVEDYPFQIGVVKDNFPYMQFTTSKQIMSNVNGGPPLGANDHFGSSIAPIGDLNGDGIPDLAVGAIGDSTGGAPNTFRGSMQVLFMNRDGTVQSSKKIASGLNGGPTLHDYDGFGKSATSPGGR